MYALKTKMNKKSQQEIIGFVLIMLIILVVAVIFLGIMLRKDKPEMSTSSELNKFIITTKAYTTDCAKDYAGDYRSLEDLILYCYSANFYCFDERDPCEVLNSTYSSILDSPYTWQADEDRPIKGYNFEIYFQEEINDSTTKQSPIIDIEAGSLEVCKVKRAGMDFQRSGIGNLVTRLEICEGV